MIPSMRGTLAAALTVTILALSCAGAPVSLDNALVLPGGSSYSSEDTLPLAPELTKKVLPNGLTYYVRRNSNPGGRAVMFLIVNSGSTNERADQSGYAHFVEHMAFNGTTSFPENELVNYLRSIGMDFGAEINAHTTREETLYTLQMPLDDPSFFDTGLKVLKEWATAVTFDPVEVEKEKGVILEEMRLSIGPDESARVREVRGLLAGTAHEDREPIGSAESVLAASAESLKEFYDEHYRPDRMAVIVVGDIDTTSVAARIEEHFSFPSRDGETRTRPSFAVSPSTDMGFVATFDPQIRRSILSYRKIVPYEPETIIGDYERLLRIRLAAESIRMRLSDLSRSGQAAWREAYFDDDYFFGRTRLYSFTIEAAEGNELSAFAGLTAEVERLRRHGFTDSEYRRTIDIYRRWLGTLDVEDDDLRSFSFAEEYVRNFMYGEPVPGVVNERVYIKKVLDTMSLESLNEAGRAILGADEGFVSLRARTGEANAALTEQAFERVLRDARNAVLNPLEAGGDELGLFDSVPEPGTIVSEESLPDNITRLTLSNGAKVLLKPTTYDKDAVSFIAWSSGGYTSLPVDRQTAATFAPSLLSAAGLGGMSATRLEEQTASLNIGLQWSIAENGEVLAGKSSTKDLESFLRLVYLSSAEPGRDARAFNAARDRLSEQVGPYVKDPAYRFESSWSSNLFGGNPRVASLDAAAIKALDFEDTRQLVIDSLADASEFTYVLVGDFSLDATKALVAKYIGAIPAGTRDEHTWIEPLYPQGPSRRVDFPVSKERRASVRMVWSAQAPWTWQREATLELMAQALNNRLLDALRENLGGTYVVSTKAAFSRYPVEQYSFIVRFDTDPDRVDELLDQVRAEVSTLRDGSFSEQYIKQVQTATERDVAGRGRTNDYWVNRLGNALASGLDLDIMGRARQTMSMVNMASFEALSRELLDSEQLFEYVMLPE